MKRVTAFIVFLCGMLYGVPIAAGVPINEAYFPDASFRSHVSQYDTGWTEYDSDGVAHTVGRNDGILDWPELSRVTGMNPPGKSMKGIEHFTNLEVFGCGNHDLTEIDVSALSNLGLFNCFENHLKTLDVSHNSALYSLLCFDNELTQLNVGSNPQLKILMCSQNPIGQLNVSNNSQLEELYCVENELKALNVSNNRNLKVLFCYNNYIEDLDVSNNTELVDLLCPNNPLGELDVTRNTKLERLRCGSNDLKTLDVTNNTLLTELECWSNHLTELDLSKNTRLTKVLLGVQEATGLKVKVVDDGYQVCLKDYVSNVENIDISKVGANGYSARLISYDGLTGNVVFNERPKVLNYFYRTHSPNNDLLYVEIKESFNVEVIERGGPTENIIYGMKDNCYLDAGGNALTEASIAGFSAKKYGKKGFTADGNSRLIVRVQTSRPGSVTFTPKDSIGVQVERLTDRADITGTNYYLSTTETSRGNYQASAVLIAPERFPVGKNFPEDKFTVHVKFTAESDGSEEIPEEERVMEEDIELEIHAAPVVLIHSLGSTITVESSFSSGGNGHGSGVLPVLRAEGFKVHSFNYDGTKGISSSNILNPYFGDLFCKIFMIFDDYLKKGIVCTKTDIVGHGFGGLVARHFCMPTQRLDDGNYFTWRSYRQGMVRRIVTISTPHMGTLWGNANTDDWRLIKENASLGSSNAIYSAMRYLHANFMLLIFGNRSTGKDMLMVNSSAWDDVSVGSIYTNSGFPMDVPMYSIHGKIKKYMDSLHMLKTLLSIGVGKFFDSYNKLSTMTRVYDKFLKVISKINLKVLNPSNAARISAIEAKFAAINEELAEPRIIEQLKLFLKGADKADFEALIEKYKKADEILAQIKASQIDAVGSKYFTVKADLTEVVDILRSYGDLYAEYGSDMMDIINLTNEALSFELHENNVLSIPSWITGLAEIAGVVINAPGAIFDLILEMPFAVMKLMFGENDDYDMFTSQTSAAGNFAGASLGLEGWDYRYDHICKLDHVGYEVVKVLRQYNLGSLKVFGSSGTYQSAGNTLTYSQEGSSEEDDITVNPEEIFETHFTLTAEPAELKITDTGYVTLNAEADTQITEPVFAVLRKDGNDTIVPMFSTEDNKFELILKLESSDAGTMIAYCFSESGTGLIYKSNMTDINILPEFAAESLLFSGSTDGVIFTSAGADIYAGLYAAAKDGTEFDVSPSTAGTVWTSSNPAIAYVTDDGHIHALADGTATLTAEYSGLSASIIVNVGSEFTAPEVLTSQLDNATQEQEYSYDLQASGTPVFSWRIINGRLPAGLELSTSGKISGTPEERGTFTITVEASNISGSSSREISLTVDPKPGQYTIFTEENFTDENFRNFIINTFDSDGNGKISDEEISTIKNLDVSKQGISSLKGIEYLTALEYLTCENNTISELDLSENKNLLGLACSYNNLTHLELSNQEKLRGIWCTDNNLESLTVNNCPALEVISVFRNNMETIELLRCPSLVELSCWGNKITAIDITGCPNLDPEKFYYDEGVEILQGSGSISINSTNFPDAVFREYVKGFDGDGDGSLSSEEMNSVTHIDVNRMGIHSLQGIEYFPNLYTLFCERNHLTELDVSANTALDHLDFANYGDEGEEAFNPEDYNQIQAIDLSKNTALVTLQAACNGIEAIDLSKNVNLVNLDVGGNKLTALDLSNNPEIRSLWCWQNQLTALDVSNLASLELLDCNSNPLENIDVSSNTALVNLDCNNAQLTSINVSNNTNLQQLNIGGNQITSINISKNTALEQLNIGGNQITSINISSNPKLWFFDCRNNPLTALDITHNTGLTHLYYPDCGLSNVDISNNTLLEHLDCGGNGITALDISKFTNLEILWCGGNQLAALNTSSNAKLQELYCGGNRLTALDLSGNPELRVLNCEFNFLASLNVSSNTQLAALSCYSNPLAALDVTSNTQLTDLYCDNTLMTTIDVSRNTELLGFHCGGENFAYVDVSSNTKLLELGVWGHVETLDVSKNTLLEELQCQWNQLSALNVSNNPKLRILECSNNQLSSLNVSNNPELEELYCNDHYDDGEEIHAEDNNRITALDVSKSTMLRVLRCEWNMISNLDISSNTALQILDCGGNQIASLNVSNCPELQELYCSQTLMSTVDVSSNPELGTLHCGGGNFSALDVTHNAKLEALVVWGHVSTLDLSQNTQLRWLDCDGNGLEALDVSSNTLLENLDCSYNALTTIDVSKNVNLRRFHCERNFLTDLDVSKNTLLEELDFSNRFDDGEERGEFNRVTNIDVSKNSALRYLGCVDNGISTLNVTNNPALEGLDFSGNQVSAIDISKNPALTGLWCGGNQLTALNLSSNPRLEILCCDWNQITSLNLSNNPLIHELRCENNYLSALNVSNLAELYTLDCDNNPLTALDVSHNPELNFFRCGENFVEEPYHQPELTSINLANNPKLEHVYLCGNRLTEIDVSNNPRLNFLDLQDNCLDELDVSANPELEFLCLQNILNPGGNQLETLDLSNNNNMKHLQVSGNKLAAINVSNMPMLEVLECAQNYITALDVTHNPELRELKCYKSHVDWEQRITALDVTQNPKLVVLECWGNRIQSLNLSNNPLLEVINVAGNPITTLDLSNQPELSGLWCHQCQLTGLDLSHNTKLENIECGDNPIGTLDVSMLPELQQLHCYNNGLSSLNVANNPNLHYLNCSGNSISALDLSNNTMLEWLECSANNLTSLNVSMLWNLRELYCNANSLSVLDLGNNNLLEALGCDNNKLTGLNVSNLVNLHGLWCGANQISAIDLSKNTLLEHLNVGANQLSTLNLSNNTELLNLECSENPLEALDVSRNTKLITLFCHDDMIVALDVSMNIELVSLDCSNNGMTALTLGDKPELVYLDCTGNSLTQVDVSGCPKLDLSNGDSFAYDGGVNIIDGTVKPEFRNFSIMMQGQIGMNFYVYIPDDSYTPENCWMEFNIRGDTAHNPQPLDYSFSRTVRGVKLYGFRCYINAGQMADPITATLHYGNGQTITKDYSAKTYLDTALGTAGFSQVIKDLMTAIKNYGHYVQPMLSKERGWVIGEKYLFMEAQTELTDDDINNAMQAVKPYAVSRNINGTGISDVKFSLTMGSETTINVYIFPASGYSGSVAAYIDGSNQNNAIRDGAQYKVRISNISAKNLGDMHTITIVADKETTVKISALSYADTILSSTLQKIGKVDIDTMRKAATALYNYYKAARAYANSL